MAENTPEQGQQQTVVVVQTQQSNILGILSLVFSLISFFIFAIIFVPLGLIFGIIALFKKQVLLGVIGIVLALISAWLSPTFWALFGVSAVAAAH